MTQFLGWCIVLSPVLLLGLILGVVTLCCTTCPACRGGISRRATRCPHCTTYVTTKAPH
jgi:hypothetical protein